MLSSGLPVTPEDAVPVGATVRITTGRLTGMVGKVIRRAKRDQFVAVVRFLGRGAMVDLQDWQVEWSPNDRDGDRRLARCPVSRSGDSHAAGIRDSSLGDRSAARAASGRPGKPRSPMGSPRADPLGGLGVAPRFLQPLGRVIAVSRHAFIMLADPIAHVRPSVGVHAKLGCACGRVELAALNSCRIRRILCDARARRRTAPANAR